jgi:hypothetical protein
VAVEWTRLSGEATEELVAVLLCRRHPSATVIRPSRGDGGIDLLVPRDDGGYEVYQVKKFSTNLTSRQKGQITTSYERVQQHCSEQELDVRAWHLTMPLNPTNENLAWLTDLTSRSAFSCDWRGYNFVEGLAAEFPDVIDYYLHDGAGRLAEVVGKLTEAMHMPPKTDGAGLITPAQVAEHLGSLQPALDTDPHFRYAISIDPQPPPTPNDPGLILAMTSGCTDQDGTAVTVKVFPRFAEALAFRPIPMTVTFQVDPGSQFEQDLKSFRKFGTPLEAPAGSVSLDADLPGGLNGSFDGGSAKIGPALRTDNTGTYVLRFAAVDPTGSVVAEALLDMEPVSVGQDRTGIRACGTDRKRVFDVEILTDLEDRHFKMKLATRDPSGRAPSELVDSIRLLLALRAPNGLAIAGPYGPISAPPLDLIQLPDWLHQGALQRLLLIVECLVAIQSHTTQQVVMPPIGLITPEAIDAWLSARELLDGQTLTLSRSEVTLCLNPGVSPPDGQFPFAVNSDFAVRIGDRTVDLGKQITHCERGEVSPESVREHRGHLDCAIRAVEGSPMTIRLAGPTAV